MIISHAIAISIFFGHISVMLLASSVVVYCGFDAVCTFTTLEHIPILGRAPPSPESVRLVSFHNGMMDNTFGAIGGYLPALLLAAWAIRRQHVWLARRVLLALFVSTVATLIGSVVVYFRIRHLVQSDAVEFMAQAPVPLAIVACAALWVAVTLPKSGQHQTVSNDAYSYKWRRVLLSKVLFGGVALVEALPALLVIASPATAAQVFEAMTGHGVADLAKLGLEVPMCHATVVLGAVAATIFVICARRPHKHFQLLLLPGVILRFVMLFARATTIVSARRRPDAASVELAVRAFGVIAGAELVATIVSLCALGLLHSARERTQVALPAVELGVMRGTARAQHADSDDPESTERLSGHRHRRRRPRPAAQVCSNRCRLCIV